MGVLAIIFFILFIIIGIVGIGYIIFGFAAKEKDCVPIGIGLFVGAFVPTLIIWLLNLYAFPNPENRYVPHTEIAAIESFPGSAEDEVKPVDSKNINVGQVFYLQTRIRVDNRSFARRFFGDNRIDFRIEISNPEMSSFIVERSQGYEEYKEPVIENNKTTYFFRVLAVHPELIQSPSEINAINFRGEAKEPGIQQIKILFDGKVSGTYSRVVTFEYKPQLAAASDTDN